MMILIKVTSQLLQFISVINEKNLTIYLPKDLQIFRNTQNTNKSNFEIHELVLRTK